jgi:hypothetical protein
MQTIACIQSNGQKYRVYVYIVYGLTVMRTYPVLIYP